MKVKVVLQAQIISSKILLSIENCFHYEQRMKTKHTFWVVQISHFVSNDQGSALPPLFSATAQALDNKCPFYPTSLLEMTSYFFFPLFISTRREVFWDRFGFGFFFQLFTNLQIQSWRKYIWTNIAYGFFRYYNQPMKSEKQLTTFT